MAAINKNQPGRGPPQDIRRGERAERLINAGSGSVPSNPDSGHTAHHVQTLFTPAQQTVVVYLRCTLLRPPPDLLAATQEFEFSCPHVTCSGLRKLGTCQRLTHPSTPRTNGMVVESFKCRTAHVLKPCLCNSRGDLKQTLRCCLVLYNHQLPRSAPKAGRLFRPPRAMGALPRSLSQKTVCAAAMRYPNICRPTAAACAVLTCQVPQGLKTAKLHVRKMLWQK